jgi:transposase
LLLGWIVGSRRFFPNVWTTGSTKIIRFAVVELDLGELGFGGIDPKATGRPSYHPAALLKLYIYGYLNRVPSSRRLERKTDVQQMFVAVRLNSAPM